jgi:hypothetical protein
VDVRNHVHTTQIHVSLIGPTLVIRRNTLQNRQKYPHRGGIRCITSVHCIKKQPHMIFCAVRC